MAFSAVSGGFAFIELVCVRGPIHSTSHSGVVYVWDLRSLSEDTECIVVLLNQQAGIRRLQ